MSEVSGIELEKDAQEQQLRPYRLKEIWGYDQSYIETARGYRTNSI